MDRLILAVPVLIAAVAVAVSGCAAPAVSESALSKSMDESSISATPTEVSMPPESTVQQLAAEVAGYAAQTKALEMDSDCSRVEYGARTGQNEGLDGMTAFSCFINKGTMTTYAQILSTGLEELAPYPAEVSELVEETMEKADKVAVVSPADFCTEDATSDSCRLALLNYRLHQPGLEALIAKWRPYGA